MCLIRNFNFFIKKKITIYQSLVFDPDVYTHPESPQTLTLFSLLLSLLLSLLFFYLSYTLQFANPTLSLSESSIALSPSHSHSSIESLPFPFPIYSFPIPPISNFMAMSDGKMNLPDDLFSSKLSDSHSSLKGELI